MSEMNSGAIGDHNSVLLIGGPDAGKSNFLFRLWIAIDHGSGALIKDGLPSELEYLRGGAERLLNGEFAVHTPEEVRELVVVPVKSSTLTGSFGGLMLVPDVAGEQVLAICRNRHWSQAWEDLISSRCACLLFVRAGSDEIVAPLDWATCFEKYGSVIEDSRPKESQGASTAGTPGSKVNRIDDEKAPQTPTQVVLTEWLQFLRQAFTAVVGGSFRPRVGIVISAWDAAPSEQQPAGPKEYVKENFPMLYQFISANKDVFDFQVFGVSIVAGDLKNDDEFREAYLSGRPCDFGFIVHFLSGELEQSPDITLPVAWALRLLPGAP